MRLLGESGAWTWCTRTMWGQGKSAGLGPEQHSCPSLFGSGPPGSLVSGPRAKPALCKGWAPVDERPCGEVRVGGGDADKEQ